MEFKQALIIEDDIQLQLALERIFRFHIKEFEIKWAENYMEAIRLLHDQSFDLIISDYCLPDFKSGKEIFEKCMRIYPNTPFLMISGMNTQDFIHETKALENMPMFLSKPFRSVDFVSIVQYLVYDRRAPACAA